MALELSYVNSSLQLLKEELEELDGSAEADRPEGCVYACSGGGVHVGGCGAHAQDTVQGSICVPCCCVQDTYQNQERGIRVPGEVGGGHWGRAASSLRVWAQWFWFQRRCHCPYDPPGAEGDQGAGLVHTPEGKC